MTLTEFLLARIAEDEARTNHRDASYTMHWPDCDYPGDIPGFCNCGLAARALAECEAKRRIAELHDGTVNVGCPECDYAVWPCRTIRATAYVYSDHPDYDPAWSLDDSEVGL